MICTQLELWMNNLALILKVSRIGGSLIITKKNNFSEGAPLLVNGWLGFEGSKMVVAQNFIFFITLVFISALSLVVFFNFAYGHKTFNINDYFNF